MHFAIMSGDMAPFSFSFSFPFPFPFPFVAPDPPIGMSILPIIGHLAGAGTVLAAVVLRG
jgi:hypothetical protein